MSNAAKKNTFPKTIEIEITDEENTIRMKDHLEIEFKIDATKAQRAAKMAEYNADLKALRQQRSELITTIKSKKEKRDIDCYQDPDFRRNIMFTKRADTDQVIDERALTLEERQETLPGTTAKPAKPKAPKGSEDPVVEDDYKPEGHVEGKPGEKPTEDAGATTAGGKVQRIKASDVKKKKAERAKKAARAVESNGAGEDEGNQSA
jgi:hypothetical protein